MNLSELFAEFLSLCTGDYFCPAKINMHSEFQIFFTALALRTKPFTVHSLCGRNHPTLWMKPFTVRSEKIRLS